MEKEKNNTNCQNDNLETNAQQKCKRRRTVTVAGTAIFAAISVLLYITKVPPFVF
jgi:hypothetical protein